MQPKNHSNLSVILGVGTILLIVSAALAGSVAPPPPLPTDHIEILGDRYTRSGHDVLSLSPQQSPGGEYYALLKWFSKEPLIPVDDAGCAFADVEEDLRCEVPYIKKVAWLVDTSPYRPMTVESMIQFAVNQANPRLCYAASIIELEEYGHAGAAACWATALALIPPTGLPADLVPQPCVLPRFIELSPLPPCQERGW